MLGMYLSDLSTTSKREVALLGMGTRRTWPWQAKNRRATPDVPGVISQNEPEGDCAAQHISIRLGCNEQEEGCIAFDIPVKLTNQEVEGDAGQKLNTSEHCLEHLPLFAHPPA